MRFIRLNGCSLGWVYYSLDPPATPLAGGYAYTHVVNLERCYERFLLLVFRLSRFSLPCPRENTEASERFPGSELVCRSGKDSLSTRQRDRKRKRERERERDVFKRITNRHIAKIHGRKIVVVVVGSVPAQSLFLCCTISQRCLFTGCSFLGRMEYRRALFPWNRSRRPQPVTYRCFSFVRRQLVSNRTDSTGTTRLFDRVR